MPSPFSLLGSSTRKKALEEKIKNGNSPVDSKIPDLSNNTIPKSIKPRVIPKPLDIPLHQKLSSSFVSKSAKVPTKNIVSREIRRDQRRSENDKSPTAKSLEKQFLELSIKKSIVRTSPFQTPTGSPQVYARPSLSRSLESKSSYRTLSTAALSSPYLQRSSILDTQRAANKQSSARDLTNLLNQSRRDPDFTNLRLAKRKTPRGLIGLSNLGNTCFMNSILQCVLSTELLMGYFINNIYKCELNKKSTMKGQIALVFAELVLEFMNEAPDKVIAPSKFKRQIEKWAPQFVGYRQQDSQEFLRFMLDGLHEDLNRVLIKPKWNITDSQEDLLSDADKAKLAFNKYQSLNSSIISDFFGGQLQSTVTCLECQYKSLTFETFLDLSLPIPKKYHARSSVCNLSDCLDEFTKTEVLDDTYKCSKCKSHQKASKSLSIYKFPQILVIHLKRFSFASYSKLETTIKFPVRDFRLNTNDDISKSKSDVYDLYGISNHMGGLGGGHYIAHHLCFDDNQWYVKDDSSVTKCNIESISGMPTAYVLFYKKR